jgi:tetratricopeptide (TPR) repeat protein
MKSRLPILLALGVALLVPPSAFAAKGFSKLDEMSLDRWAKLRETERYQMKIAEKYYDESNWSVAADEYEKYVSLYETSEGASYAQYMWSMCQVKLKKQNTAIKDGFQTVIDYWPDSAEAVAAAYLIGKTYKDIGDLGPAKQAYANVTTKHADEMVAILARLDLADIARIEQDRERRIAVLKELVYQAPRVGDAGQQVARASETLASLYFNDGAFVDGKAALATTHKEPGLVDKVNEFGQGAISTLVGQAEKKALGLKLADDFIKYYQELQSAASADENGKLHVKKLTYDIAAVHSRAGRPEETVRIFEKMLVDYPNQDDVFVNYAGWLKAHGKYDEARILFGRMKNPITAQKLIAQSYREERKPLLALPVYQALMSADVANADSYQWDVAVCYHEAGKYQEAIGAYQLTTSFPRNLYQIAECQKALRQYREAIGTYAQIVGGYQDQAPNALLQVALTQQLAERAQKDQKQKDSYKELAIATLKQVCSKYPTTEQAARAHQHLNNDYNIIFTTGGGKAK